MLRVMFGKIMGVCLSKIVSAPWIASLLFALPVLLLGLLLTGIGSEAGPSISSAMFREPAVQDDTVLRVIQATPQGGISLEDLKKEAVVVFNHPLVPLAALEDETKGVFGITPELQGRFRWYGSRICAFIPETGWTPGVEYTLRVREGLQSLNKKKLPADFSCTFTVEIPALEVTISPSTYRNTIDYDEIFTFTFNQPVDLAALQRHLEILEKGVPHPCTLAYGKDEGGAVNQRQVQANLRGKFGRDAEIVVKVRAGLPSTGPASPLPGDAVSEYRTHGPLLISLVGSPAYFQDMWDFYFECNNQVDTATARRAFRFSPAAPLRDTGSYNTTTLYLSSWRLKPATEYTVTVDPFADVHGNMLEGDREFSFTTPDYRPEYSVEYGRNVVESAMKQLIPLTVTGIPQIQVRVGYFGIEHLQRELGSDYRQEYSIIDNITTRTINLKTGVGANQAKDILFDLAPSLPVTKKGWLGVQYLGEAVNYNGERENLSHLQYLQVTDLGVTVKEAYNATYVWVHSLSTGAPVPGATVQVYDEKALLVAGITDAAGFCRVPKPAFGMLNKALYLVQRGDDKAYISSNEHPVSMYHLCNTYDDAAYRRVLAGEIVFDRRLYRPGDTASLKAVLNVREQGVLSPLRNADVTVKINDARGNELLEQKARTTAQGGVWATVALPADAPLGHYAVIVSTDRDHYINETFQVEEFRPASFSVGVEGMRDATVGESLELGLTGRYLFGAPMQKAQVTWNVMRMKRRLSFPQYGDFTFGDGDIWEEEETDWSCAGYFTGGDGRLDALGKLSATLQLKPMPVEETVAEPARTFMMGEVYDLKLEATVRDVDEKSVTRTAFCTVTPGGALPGIRPKNRYQSYTSPFEFDLVAVTPRGDAAAPRGATVRVIMNDWKSIMTKGPGGSVEPENTLVRELVEERSVQLSGAPLAYTFRPARAGSYTITVQEQGGGAYARESFYAFGAEYASWFANDDDTITLVPDRREYKPGDTAKVLIQSPFASAKAIVSLEREGIIWQKTMEVKNAGTPLEIPMKEEYLPNVYLSVLLVRPRVQPPKDLDKAALFNYKKNDLGMPRFKAGVVKLSVSNRSRYAPLEVSTDKKAYSPGDTVTIGIQSAPNAEIALAVADRGVLDLIEYSYANPVNKFYQNWPLGVRVFENRRFLIKQYHFSQKGESPGGQGKGDELEGIGGFGKESEDGARKDIRYTAYWKPDLVADAAGKATVTFKLPHNLTTFRIMALAAAGGKFRTVEKEFQVRKAIVIQKNLPRFIRPGDTLAMGAVVINQTGLPGSFVFEVSADLLSGAAKSVTVQLAADEAREIVFPLGLDLRRYAALEREARAKLRSGGAAPALEVRGLLSVRPVNAEPFTKAGLAASEVTDKLAFRFPVREQPPEEAFTVAGVTDLRTEEFLKLPGKNAIAPEMGGMTLRLSSSALVGLEKAFGFYASNPYFCLEQRASAFLLRMTAGDLLTTFTMRPPREKEYDFGNVERLFLGEVRDFQNADGGFRFWKEARDRQSDPYLTAYVSFVLAVAKEKGYRTDDAIRAGAVKFLKGYVRKPRNDGYTYVLETCSMILYSFSLGGEYDSSIEALLLEKEKDLSLRAKGYLAMAIARNRGTGDATVQRLLAYFKNRMEITTQKVSFREEAAGSYGRAFYSDGATLGVMLRAFIALDRDNPLVTQMTNFAIADRSRPLWRDSHSAGLLALALHDYHATYETGGSSSWRGAFLLNGASLLEKDFDASVLATATRELTFDELYGLAKPEVTQPLAVTSLNRGRVYYAASLIYYPVKQVYPPRDEGIEVYRELYDIAKADEKNPDGARVGAALKRGSLYLVKLRIVSPKPCFNAVIADPVPANIEIVNTSFRTEQGSLGRFTGERERNDYWWEDSPPVTEYRDDRVVITQDYLSPGLHEYRYLVRPVLTGSASAPAGTAKLMYEPEVFGRTGSGSLEVR